MITSSLTVQKSFKQARSVYLLLAILFLVAASAFGYFRGRGLLAMRGAISGNESQIITLQKEKEEANARYVETRTAFAKDMTDFSNIIGKIVPQGERYTEFTRALDEYFARNLTPENPILASSLRFGKGAQVEDTPFFNLPTSLTITSSPENFFKFLRFVEQSGSIETGTRLMDIQGIRINFTEEDVSFTVDLRTFYRPEQ